jgi:hypothetical protein
MKRVEEEERIEKKRKEKKRKEIAAYTLSEGIEHLAESCRP